LEKSSAYRESSPLPLQNPPKKFKIGTTFVGGHRAGKTAVVPEKYVLCFVLYSSSFISYMQQYQQQQIIIICSISICEFFIFILLFFRILLNNKISCVYMSSSVYFIIFLGWFNIFGCYTFHIWKNIFYDFFLHVSYMEFSIYGVFFLDLI
jgi:hypothetical protein